VKLESGRALARTVRTVSMLLSVEPMTGIEPAYSAWEADVLPLNYIGAVALTCGNAVQRTWPRTSMSHNVTTRSKLAPASCSAANCE